MAQAAGRALTHPPGNGAALGGEPGQTRRLGVFVSLPPLLAATLMQIFHSPVKNSKDFHLSISVSTKRYSLLGFIRSLLSFRDFLVR